MTIDLEKFKHHLAAGIDGNEQSAAVIKEVLRPQKDDNIEDITEKIKWHININYLSSLKYKDAVYHRQIDEFFAEQIYSYLNTGKPRYKGILIIGYRESAKTARFKMGQSYMTLYLCLLYTSPSPRDRTRSRMPSSA